MTKKNLIHKTTWTPTKPTSSGAIAYHKAVTSALWHRENLKRLINILRKNMKKNDSIVDFGAGTGSSAYYLYKHLEKTFFLILVDNSPSWLGSAYEIFKDKSNTEFYILNKTEKGYETLEKTIGKKRADHVFCANTVHLISNLNEAFKGVYAALKPGGTFTFQSGSIIRNHRKKDILILDTTVNNVHDIAIEIIQKNDIFRKYRKGLAEKIKENTSQRKLVFPDPRPVEFYTNTLKKTGFKNITTSYKRIKVPFKEWRDFLLVKRLQAGILPEIGGRYAIPKEEKDRNTVIKMAINLFFKQLQKNNEFSTKKSFTAEWIYITSKR